VLGATQNKDRKEPLFLICLAIATSLAPEPTNRTLLILF